MKSPLREIHRRLKAAYIETFRAVKKSQGLAANCEHKIEASIEEILRLIGGTLIRIEICDRYCKRKRATE